MPASPVSKVTVTNYAKWTPHSAQFTALCHWILSIDQEARYVVILVSKNIYAGSKSGKKHMHRVGTISDFLESLK